MRAKPQGIKQSQKLSFNRKKQKIMSMIKKAVEWYCIASSALYSADMANTEALERLNDITRR